ncbi:MULTISPECIES: winged helix-turn-helix transcriptional regulator [Dermacoccus]|uniref:DNA-binding response regulator n=2 Tax=Dermacoccus TaxID=57495 RepID=A0A417Z5E1_9MICO|nr:response regulator transcription factor [Dermacoccus abyssi]RHW45695.1 DNA-binding response regulator [Dermacoccus abyssi]
MAHLLLLTNARGASVEVLPALGALAHRVRVIAPEASAVATRTDTDLVLLDARSDLVAMRGVSTSLEKLLPDLPVIGVFTEGGLVALTTQWAVSDVLVDTAGPAEVDARIRLALARSGADEERTARITAGELVIDEDAYWARIRGTALDLTYKEFELLKHLAGHPGRVFTRDQLLREVWGYDYFGGTRTVDVHVRRLRAKLGPEHDALIGTVRNVGYRFVEQTRRPDAAR